MILLGDPVSQLFREHRQLEKEVLGFAELRNLAVDLGSRVDEIDGVELVAAVVALVSPGVFEATDGACAFEVPVGERASGARRERAELLALHQVALVV